MMSNQVLLERSLIDEHESLSDLNKSFMDELSKIKKVFEDDSIDEYVDNNIFPYTQDSNRNFIKAWCESQKNDIPISREKKQTENNIFLKNNKEYESTNETSQILNGIKNIWRNQQSTANSIQDCTNNDAKILFDLSALETQKNKRDNSYLNFEFVNFIFNELEFSDLGEFYEIMNTEFDYILDQYDKNTALFNDFIGKKILREKFPNPNVLKRFINELRENENYECRKYNYDSDENLQSCQPKKEEILILNTNKFFCHVENCMRVYSSKYALKIHIEKHHMNNKFLCSKCSKEYKSVKSLKDHIYRMHREAIVSGKL